MGSFRFLCCVGVLSLLTACSGETIRGDNTAAGNGMDYAERAGAVLDDPARPADDHSDDALRKPANVLAFIGVEPGMTVFEMEAGSGYYTELLSRLVGPEGEVVMQNPERFDQFLGDAVPNRVNGRLDNVRISKTDFDNLDAEDSSVDIVTWMLGPHELYFSPSEGVSFGGVEDTYAEIVRILKPGGLFVALDHAAASGAPETTGGTTHRIDPAIVRGLATDAGLVFAGESDVLRNADDNYDTNVFDPSVRRKTDRFLMKFTKPE
ncbi:class I SAM-dependent methyltransferase [Hyphococcus sp.]|uniref:class I SAM-dependent methyltransferase n=1 Tax=Hyphococcus sp. TaxID=2038636 RepID=UPI003CCB9EC1